MRVRGHSYPKNKRKLFESSNTPDSKLLINWLLLRVEKFYKKLGGHDTYSKLFEIFRKRTVVID